MRGKKDSTEGKRGSRDRRGKTPTGKVREGPKRERGGDKPEEKRKKKKKTCFAKPKQRQGEGGTGHRWQCCPGVSKRLRQTCNEIIEKTGVTALHWRGKITLGEHEEGRSPDWREQKGGVGGRKKTEPGRGRRTTTQGIKKKRPLPRGGAFVNQLLRRRKKRETAKFPCTQTEKKKKNPFVGGGKEGFVKKEEDAGYSYLGGDARLGFKGSRPPLLIEYGGEGGGYRVGTGGGKGGQSRMRRGNGCLKTLKSALDAGGGEPPVTGHQGGTKCNPREGDKPKAVISARGKKRVASTRRKTQKRTSRYRKVSFAEGCF